MDRTEEQRTTPRWAAIGVLLLFVAALWVRLDGIDWLLPYLPEPDHVSPLQLEAIEAHTPPEDRSDWFRRYPLLLSRMASLIPRAGPAEGDDLAAHLWAASTVILRTRILNAILSSVVVVLTYRLARRFASPATALLASAFVATSLLDVLFSQQARPHGTQATLSAAAVLAALRLREKPTWTSYALAGIACGLSFTLLQNGLVTLLPLLAAHLLRERSGARGGWSRIVLPIAIVVGFVLLLYPSQEGQGMVADPDQPEFVIGPEGIQHRAHKLRFADFQGRGFPNIYGYLRDHDPALLALAAVGCVLALPAFARNWRQKELAVVLAYAVPYFVAIGLFTKTWERFLLPILPYLAILAAYAVTRIAGVVARVSPARPLGGALPASVVVLALGFPVFALSKFVSVRDAHDTVELAAGWIREHVRPDEGDILVTPGLTMPLFHDPATLDPAEMQSLHGAWLQYQAKLPASTTRGPSFRFINIPPRIARLAPAEHPAVAQSFFEGSPPAYAVLEVSRRIRQYKMVTVISDIVRSRGELVYVSSSEPEESPLFRPLSYQDMPHMVWRLLRVERLGPRVEIWKLR